MEKDLNKTECIEKTQLGALEHGGGEYLITFKDEANTSHIEEFKQYVVRNDGQVLNAFPAFKIVIVYLPAKLRGKDLAPDLIDIINQKSSLYMDYQIHTIEPNQVMYAFAHDQNQKKSHREQK